MISFKVPRPLSERYYSPCRFFYVWHAVSYRDLKKILEKRGVKIDHATLNRWVVRYLTSLVMAAKNRRTRIKQEKTMTIDSITQPLTKRPAWKALQAHYQKMHHLHLRQLFADDTLRGERFVVDASGIYLDYSKNRITDETPKFTLS